MKESIIKHIQSISEIVTDSHVYSFPFNLSELPPHNDFQLDIRKHGRFVDLFSTLNEKKMYCLYWFTCDSNVHATTLMDSLNVKRETLIGTWTVPPKNDNKDSNVIYVGVRQGGVRKRDDLSNLSGRIIQHLGYYKKGRTGALHLLQWCAEQDMNITLNVMEIGNPPHPQYLYIIEKLAAITLKPLCGKH